MSFWNRLTGACADQRGLGGPGLSPHNLAEIAGFAAMTPEDRAAFVARFNADTATWEAMRANAAQRAAQTAVAPSDTGIDGVIPLPPVENPHLVFGSLPVSDAQWAAQNRRANDILSGRNSLANGEIDQRRLERGRDGA